METKTSFFRRLYLCKDSTQDYVEASAVCVEYGLRGILERAQSVIKRVS